MLLFFHMDKRAQGKLTPSWENFHQINNIKISLIFFQVGKEEFCLGLYKW